MNHVPLLEARTCGVALMIETLARDVMAGRLLRLLGLKMDANGAVHKQEKHGGSPVGCNARALWICGNTGRGVHILFRRPVSLRVQPR
jgi:hypothetical protein